MRQHEQQACGVGMGFGWLAYNGGKYRKMLGIYRLEAHPDSTFQSPKTMQRPQHGKATIAMQHLIFYA